MVEIKMRINKTWIPTNDEWDSMWSLCPYATLFQSRAWAEIWANYLENEMFPDPIGIELSDGTKVMFPSSKYGLYKNIIKMNMFSPGYTFGGWLSATSLSVEQQELVYRFLTQKFRNFYIRENPYEPMLSIWENELLSNGHTQTIDLSEGYDKIYNRMSKGHRSAINQAKRARIYTEEASNPHEWEDYYQVYLDSIERWGKNAKTIYPWRLFYCIREKKSSNIRLWLAKLEGKIIAGAICLYSPKNVIYWHGAGLAEYFNLRPVNYMISEIIKGSILFGARWFDLNPSGGVDGVEKFKRNFGSIIMTSNTYQKKSFFLKSLAFLSKSKKSN